MPEETYTISYCLTVESQETLNQILAEIESITGLVPIIIIDDDGESLDLSE